MIKLGYGYISVFKKTFFHPFINQDLSYKQLSADRQSYANTVIDFLNLKINTVGNIPETNKILYVINHRSLLDIIVMEHVFSLDKKNGAWIAKKDLFDSFYGKFFEYSACISVDLQNKRGLLKFFKQIKNCFIKANDFNLYIFPEGERFSGHGIQKFQNGASRIAIINKLEVVPVYINDKLEEVFKNSPYKETKTIEIHFGEKIDAKNLEEEYKFFMEKVNND